MGYSVFDALRFFWVSDFEGNEAFSQTCCIFVGYREDSDAALGAAGFANEVGTSAMVGVSYCGIYDLDEGFVAALLAVGVRHKGVPSG